MAGPARLADLDHRLLPVVATRLRVLVDALAGARADTRRQVAALASARAEHRLGSLRPVLDPAPQRVLGGLALVLLAAAAALLIIGG